MRSMQPLLRLPLTVVLTCAVLGSCASGDGGGGDGGGGDGTRSPAAVRLETGELSAHGGSACAATLVYRGHTYLGRGGVKRDPATTGRLIEGMRPSCDDLGGQDPVEPDQRVQAAELADVPLETAFLWHDSIYVRKGRELPAAAQIWFEAQRCASPGEFDLTADWLGVMELNGRPGGDLRPPYRLEVHVTKGPEKYIGTTIRVHADAATDPGLGRRDVKRSLLGGGQVVAHVSCVGGRFEAHSLRTTR